MRRLLLSLLFIPFFTSSSWADPDPSDFPDIIFWEGRSPSPGSAPEMIEPDSIKKVPASVNQEEIKSIKQGQKRKSGWGQKPTSIQKKSGDLQRKAR